MTVVEQQLLGKKCGKYRNRKTGDKTEVLLTDKYWEGYSN